MRKYVLSVLYLVITLTCFSQESNSKKFVLVIHGGAGTILKSQMTPEKEKLYTQGLNDALNAGNEVLAKGGTALDAVVAAIKVLEDNPLFNAGKGAVFTNEGKNEMDAAAGRPGKDVSVMEWIVEGDQRSQISDQGFFD